MTSPRVHSGQTLRANVSGDSGVTASLYLKAFGTDDAEETFYGEAVALGENTPLSLVVPVAANPVFEVGVKFEGAGTSYIDWLTWEGTPDVVLTKPAHDGTMWQSAWINAVDSIKSWRKDNMFRLVHNEGVGIVSQGSREWQDYVVTADVTPHLAIRAGILARMQGLKRYYALVLSRGNKIQLVEALHDDTVLAEAEFDWSFGETYEMSLQVSGNQLVGSVNGTKVLEATSDTFADGAIGLLIEEGRTATNAVRIQPVA